LRVEYYQPGNKEVVYINDKPMTLAHRTSPADLAWIAAGGIIQVDTNEYYGRIFRAICPDDWKDGFVITLPKNLHNVVNRAGSYITSTRLQIRASYFVKGVEYYSCYTPGYRESLEMLAETVVNRKD